ncbi:MAG: fluoride efflux transporter CrcB [Calditrichia bacterium]
MGAVSRYLVGGWIHQLVGRPWFPYGTLGVNMLGCFFIGLLSAMAESHHLFSPQVRLLVFVGFLGSFTTYSTFSLETFSLLRDTQYLNAFFNLAIHIIMGLLGVWLGLNIGKYM